MPTIVYSQTWDVNTGTPDGSQNMTRSTTTVRTGAGSMRLHPAAAPAYWLKNVVGTPNTIVYQCWVRFAVLPNADVQILGAFGPGQADAGICYVAASAKFATFINTPSSHVAVGGPAIVINTWYRLDVRINASANPWLVDAQVEGSALTQSSGVFTALTFPDYRLGDPADAFTADVFFDDLSVSHTGADYPISSASAPSAPQFPTATPSNAQIALSWSAPASDGGSAVTAYKIYRSLTTNTETLLASPAGTGTAYTDSTTANGTAYFYKVSAVNAIGESALSSEVTATPAATPPSVTQSLVATPGDSQVALSWTAPASNGGSAVTGYSIYRGTTPGGEVSFALPPGTGTSYTDLTAVNGSLYYYRVSALNAIGEGTWSNEVSATPLAAVPGTATRTYKRFYGPALLGNTATTLYMCPASTIAVIRHVHVSNPTGSTVDFTFSIGTNAAGTRLWDGYPVPVDDVLDHYQDFSLAAGEFIQAVAGVAGLLNLTVDGYELGLVSVQPPPPTTVYPSDTLFPSN